MKQDTVSQKAWGVDLYTEEELVIRLEQINATISEYDKDKPLTPLQKQVVKIRDAFAVELKLRNEPKEKQLTPEQVNKVKHAVSMMQLTASLLKEVDERQQYVGSESERLFSLSLQVLERYDMMPHQQAESEDK